MSIFCLAGRVRNACVNQEISHTSIISCKHVSALLSFRPTLQPQLSISWNGQRDCFYFSLSEVIEKVIVGGKKEKKRNQAMKPERCVLSGVQQSNAFMHGSRKRTFSFQTHNDGISPSWEAGKEKARDNGRKWEMNKDTAWSELWKTVCLPAVPPSAAMSSQAPSPEMRNQP